MEKNTPVSRPCDSAVDGNCFCTFVKNHHIFVDLFLGSLLCSVELCDCPSANTTLPSLL